MLDEIEKSTFRFKKMLIQLGIELPPVTMVFNNKIKQINLDYKQMAMVLTGKYHGSLYKNASDVFLACTATYYTVENLFHLKKALEQSIVYISQY